MILEKNTATAPKGRDSLAQGIALGMNRHLSKQALKGEIVIAPLKGSTHWLHKPGAMPWAFLFLQMIDIRVA
jgi:hypothetical protein